MKQVITLYKKLKTYQFRKVKSFKYKITAECDYKKRAKEEVKTTKFFSILIILIIMQYMNMVTSIGG